MIALSAHLGTLFQELDPLDRLQGGHLAMHAHDVRAELARPR